MSIAQVLAQQETSVSDARISQLSECKFLSEQEVIELAAKCKVGCGSVCCPCMKLQRCVRMAVHDSWEVQSSGTGCF